jgi:predicted dienelactone hydrolase
MDRNATSVAIGCIGLVLFAAACGGGASGADAGPDGDEAQDVAAADEASALDAEIDVAVDTNDDAAGEADIAADPAQPDPEMDAPVDAGDVAQAEETEDTSAEAPSVDAAPEEITPPPPDPWAWGPYQVGTTSFQWFDLGRLRSVPTTVWYPAKPLGQPKATYLMVVPGNAYSQASPDLSAAPYPLVLFSHGFRGTAVQSITFTEFLASHGYVVAAMDHSGNTLTDFFSDDKKVSEVAMERPNDVFFAYQQVLKASATPGGFLSGMVDETRVGMSGHSFGGYTALMISGGQVNVNDAVAACAAGTPADIFCDYVVYWPAGATVKFEHEIPGLKGTVALAPGGSAAFGPAGLAGVTVPVVMFSGTLDDTCPVDIEIEPMYQGLPAPKAEGVLESASHMSYTNVCNIPLSDQFIKDYCGVAGMLGPEETFAAVNGVAVSWLNRYVKGDEAYAQFLETGFLQGKCPTMHWKIDL